MRPALLSSKRQQPAGDVRTVFVPAPTKGWNTAMNLGIADPLTAPVLTNMYPTDGGVQVMTVSTSFATKAATTFNSVFAYKGLTTASDKLFAAASSGIYDITAGGAIGAAIAITITNGFFETTQFVNSAGSQFVVGVNGVDQGAYFDGASWTQYTNVTFTNVSSVNLNFIWAHKRRLWYVEKNSGNAWYLPVDSIQGAATKFVVGPNFTKGGFLLCGATWTLDSGAGPDDYMVFISSQGEAVVYAGTDPASAATWASVGTFYIGKPVDKRCTVSIGGDLWIATQFGLISMNRIMKGERADPAKAVSAAIWPTWTKAATTAIDSGWRGFCFVPFPRQNALICSIPSDSSGSTNQFVLNLTTMAWSRSFLWSCWQFTVFNNKLYGGKIAAVLEMWPMTGGQDQTLSGSGVICECQQAYLKLGGGRRFEVVAVRPRFSNNRTAVTFTPGLQAAFVTRFTTEGTINAFTLVSASPRICEDFVNQPERWYNLDSQEPEIEGSFVFAGGIRPTLPDAFNLIITTWLGTEFQIRLVN